MKKSFLFLAVCAAALTACTSEEVIEEGVQSNAIGFQNLISKESRALTTGEGGTFNKFYVYGYYTQADATNNPVSVFDGEEVTLKDGVWSYDNTRYWVPGANYRFYAFSCENAKPTTPDVGLNLEGGTKEQRALKIVGYTTHNHHDLVFATNDDGIIGKNKGEGNEKVALTFKHILSKIKVEFDSEFAPGYDIEVSKVSIQNVYDKADYNPYSTPTWGNVTRTSTDEINPTTLDLALIADKNISSAADPNVEGSEELKAATVDGYVIPHEYSTSLVKLVFTIDVKQGNDVMFSRTLTGSWSPKWEEGKAYKYNVKINGSAAELEPIVFETSQDIDGWDAGDTSEVNMSFSAN